MLGACSSDSGNAQSAAGDSAAAATERGDSNAAQVSVPSPATGTRAPAVLRGLYLNAYAAGSKARLPKLLAIADSTEINAFVIDVKDEKGMRYRTELALWRPFTC